MQVTLVSTLRVATMQKYPVSVTELLYIYQLLLQETRHSGVGWTKVGLFIHKESAEYKI